MKRWIWGALVLAGLTFWCDRHMYLGEANPPGADSGVAPGLHVESLLVDLGDVAPHSSVEAEWFITNQSDAEVRLVSQNRRCGACSLTACVDERMETEFFEGNFVVVPARGQARIRFSLPAGSVGQEIVVRALQFAAVAREESRSLRLTVRWRPVEIASKLYLGAIGEFHAWEVRLATESMPAWVEGLGDNLMPPVATDITGRTWLVVTVGSWATRPTIAVVRPSGRVGVVSLVAE